MTLQDIGDSRHKQTTQGTEIVFKNLKIDVLRSGQGAIGIVLVNNQNDT